MKLQTKDIDTVEDTTSEKLLFLSFSIFWHRVNMKHVQFLAHHYFEDYDGVCHL